MKVAIANDGTGWVSEHFGRSPTFEIYQVEGGSTRLIETRENPRAYAGQLCQEPVADLQGGSPRGAWIRQAFADCDMVIFAGIAGPALRALQDAGARPMRLRSGLPIGDTLRSLTEGGLEAR